MVQLPNEVKIQKISHSLQALKTYIESEKYSGWDPYDGLNSRVLRLFKPLSKNRIVRLLWIQFFKKSRLNFRRLLRVPKEYNPKAVALFLSGYCSLYRTNVDKENLAKAKDIGKLLITLNSKGYKNACWGYNFDWQARSGFKPAYTPTSVVTSFAGCALLDLFEITGDTRFYEAAYSACKFILEDINRTAGSNGTFCFSYSPNDTSQVYNASLLASKLLARMYSVCKEPRLVENARASVKYCCDRQASDGSWMYSPEPFHQWIDNFHTGFNLESIAEYERCAEDKSFSQNLSTGFSYYINTFFSPEGIVKYYNNSTYPIDIHAIAQFFSTLSTLGNLQQNEQLIDAVLNWTLENMQHESGYFYFQRKKRSTNKIPYMRWSQAWMFYGLSKLYKEAQYEEE